MNKNIFIIAAEKSADNHGASLMKKLSNFSFEGIGGEKMALAGLKSLYPIERFSVMGFSDVLIGLPKFVSLFKKIQKRILDKNPKAVVFIDYPGFNLRMAKSLRKKGFKGKLIQYICPQVWAWGKKRIPLMENTLDLLLTTLPFEPSLFNQKKLKVEYVGNPVLDSINNQTYSETKITENKNLIAIFPGSRQSEVISILPKQLKGALLLKKAQPDCCFGISCASHLQLPIIQHMLMEMQLHQNQDFFIVPPERTYDLMKQCRSAISKSGTTTLELALHQKPTVVVYHISKINYLIARYLLNINLRYYCLTNIIANRDVFPELIKAGFTKENIFHNIYTLNSDNLSRKQCIQDCALVKEILSLKHSPSENAANAIKNLIL